MIRHSVLFTLRHADRSKQEREFLQSTQCLRQIPGVTGFELFRQTSSKNPFAFGLSMAFQSAEAYQRYVENPIHSDFVSTRWMPEVTAFLEVDFAPIHAGELLESAG